MYKRQLPRGPAVVKTKIVNTTTSWFKFGDGSETNKFVTIDFIDHKGVFSNFMKFMGDQWRMYMCNKVKVAGFNVIIEQFNQDAEPIKFNNLAVNKGKMAAAAENIIKARDDRRKEVGSGWVPFNNMEWYDHAYNFDNPDLFMPVSYTHLDVYKRQVCCCCCFPMAPPWYI